MAKVFDEIDERLEAFIRAQPLFFVGTAPNGDGHVNVSPKGPIETFRVLDGRTVEYDDRVGSGAETAAHVRENGRVCVMFCAFSGPPRIVRLHGRGEVIPGDPASGVRGVIRVHLDRISDSCGYGVPLLEHVAERPQFERWAAAKGPDGLREYVRDRNSRSIDDLPAFPES